ncbi:TolC family protein [Tolypothrix sp. FACHB-123]|uniref:TolC family protein n=1 Tax=Tolypothrix sp. FACHB-123 TaxID=2692868 RepID=UPI001687AA2F|nr:TolC family protein [Tolypothrix sp. FACHB-123]MBD2355271.1 TolC family protein [Tolypothrix sp. FACHB-123]
MNGQQLFHTFLPGVTAAVLTTQPAWAGTVKVNGLQPASSPSVLTARDSRTLVADGISSQFYIADQKVPNLVPLSDGIVAKTKPLSYQPLSHHSIPVNETGNASAIAPQTLKGNQSRFYSFSSTTQTAQNLDINLLADARQTTNNSATFGQKLENIVVQASNVKLPTVEKNQLLLSALQRPKNQKKKPQTQLQAISPVASKNPVTPKFLELPNCSQQQGQLNSGVSCAKTTTAKDLIAQTTPGSTVPTQTIPGSTVPTQTTPGTVVPIQNVPGLVGPAPAGSVQVPENLIPNPNPLQYPTNPAEVTLQSNQPITLVQALELARRNNRELQVAQLELERSQAALREAQAALLPTVGITGDITRQRTVNETYSVKLQQQQQEGLPPAFREPIEPAASNTNFNAQAQLSYDLYTSGRRQATIREAEERVRLSELAIENQSEDIRLNVATEYYNLQQADEQVRIAESAVNNAQASLRDAEALERAGVGTRFDVLRSQVNLANSQQELTNSRSQQQIARRRLATRLSLPQSVNISAADPVKLAGLWNQTLEQSIVLAYQNRPDLQQLLVQRNISEQQRRQALSALGPQVSLIASYDFFDRFNDAVSVADGYSVGVRATLNLFDGGASRARAAQARANIAIAETQFAEQRNQIRFQVEQAFSNQQSNLENVQTANTALEQAREALRLARLRFQAGVGTQTDVINSENDLTRAEGNRIRAILDYNRALAELQRSVTSRAFRQ